jgi:hypothetical protein
MENEASEFALPAAVWFEDHKITAFNVSEPLAPLNPDTTFVPPFDPGPVRTPFTAQNAMG